MSKFEIPETTEMLCVKFQTRNEKHGEADVTAADLRVRWLAKNSALDMLHPQLRESLCSAIPDQETAQGEMPLEASDLAFVRFKDLVYPLTWNREFLSYTLHVDYGVGDEKANMIVKLCKLHNFKVTPQEGALCEIEFTISSSADITERFAGKMALQQQQKVFIKLLAPNKVEGEVIDASAGSGAPGTGDDTAAGGDAGLGDPNTSATAAFVAQHGADTKH